MDLCVKDYTGRFMYIGTKIHHLIVLDFKNDIGPEDGGLYLWHVNNKPSNLDLDFNRNLKIIGIDLV